MNQCELSPLDRLKAVWADLTYSYREFLKYLIAVWKLCRKVFPCLLTIAEKIGFSKSTVNRAKNFFMSIGVLCYKKTAYTSNTYFIDDQVLRINFKNRNWCFTQVNEPVCEPVSIVANNNKIYVQDVPLHKQRKEPQKQQDSSPYAWILRLPAFLQKNFMKHFNPSYAWVFKKASESELALAYEDLVWYTSQPKGRDMPIQNRPKFLFKRIMQRMNKRNKDERSRKN